MTLHTTLPPQRRNSGAAAPANPPAENNVFGGNPVNQKENRGGIHSPFDFQHIEQRGLTSSRVNPRSKKCGVAVIGAGHAGVEAALAAARLGADVLLFAISLDAVANMPCNPAVGGTGKGHLVFEIDAMGGIMGRAADASILQSRMLNSSKGPAVRSLRLQADRRAYHAYVKQALEECPNIRIIQAEVAEICVEEASGERRVAGVLTSGGTYYEAACAVICTGTYLESTIIAGEVQTAAGPDNLKRSERLAGSLASLGVRLRRFKTGTPPRIHAGSIDYSRLALQPGDEPPVFFSKDTDPSLYRGCAQLPCYIAYTTPATHEIIRANLHRAPMYSGVIKGTGTRYCPSIEDKVVRFADKERHQLFVEPMGAHTAERYISGLSTSFPEEIQELIVHSISGLEKAHIMRYAYAIEYWCCDPLQLRHTLEFREIGGLFGAGQFNGTSGYEEAAAQGLVAGANAALKIAGRPPFTLPRSSSYTGMLIDDLVLKGTEEPYRVMTSRTEYRLALRQDNAGERLAPLAYAAGLISSERYEREMEEVRIIEAEVARVRALAIPPSEEVNRALEAAGSSPISAGARYFDLLKRPELDYASTASIDPERPAYPPGLLERACTRIKYEGYIRRQQAEIERQTKLEGYRLPEGLDYKSMKGLRLEALAKLDKFRPSNIGEASRISGVSPADITALLINLGR